MYELKNCYTLDEMLLLYGLYKMEKDIENSISEELKRNDD